VALPPRAAQAKEQFVPCWCTARAYAPYGIPWANGKQDYLKLVNARGRHQRREDHVRRMRNRYDTDRGVECYERLKTGRRALVDPSPPASPLR
jgi:branched-chain amino acid transport system substrate-binding protein